MLAIVILIALLNFAEASLKTPRTASPPGSGLSSASTVTTSVVALPLTTTTTNSIILSGRFNNSSSITPQATRPAGAKAETRNTALRLDAPTSVITGNANSPEITPSPELDPPGGNFNEIGVKYVQTTYWSCVEFPLETHCGWHQPILDAGTGRAQCECNGRAALRAGIVAGVVAGGLVLGI